MCDGCRWGPFGCLLAGWMPGWLPGCAVVRKAVVAGLGWLALVWCAGVCITRALALAAVAARGRGRSIMATFLRETW